MRNSIFFPSHLTHYYWSEETYVAPFLSNPVRSPSPGRLRPGSDFMSVSPLTPLLDSRSTIEDPGKSLRFFESRFRVTPLRVTITIWSNTDRREDVLGTGTVRSPMYKSCSGDKRRGLHVPPTLS